jgi:NAD+ diphosphatase
MMNRFKMANAQKMIAPGSDAFCIAFNVGKVVLIKDNASYRLPKIKELDLIEIPEMLKIGELSQNDCCTIELELDKLPERCKNVNLREALALLETHECAASSRARQMLLWNKEHQFCGYCGQPTRFSDSEPAKLCTSCKARFYPRIMPAVITAITRDDEILLAHNAKFRDGLYSLIAGFVEAGESLEAAVRREIFEEVGIKVKNIKYFKSQSWPFPQSLMIGFTAEYDSGEIQVDGREIVDAKWFKYDNMPILPRSTSISRKLIDSFLDSRK